MYTFNQRCTELPYFVRLAVTAAFIVQNFYQFVKLHIKWKGRLKYTTHSGL